MHFKGFYCHVIDAILKKYRYQIYIQMFQFIFGRNVIFYLDYCLLHIKVEKLLEAM